MLRVKKYLPPGLQVFAQESLSYSRVLEIGQTLRVERWGFRAYLDLLKASFSQKVLGRLNGMEG